MSGVCTRCHGTGLEPVAIDDEKVEAVAELLREKCGAEGWAITFDDLVSRETAAELLSMKNSRSMYKITEEAAAHVVRRANRLWYPISWVARRLVAKRSI